MRTMFALAGLAALAFAQTASAAPVSIAPISFSPEFQAELNDDIGVREGPVLQRAAERSVAEALARHGATVSAAAPVTIEISIINADPNRPTMEQLRNEPSLSSIYSVSVGGAELRAVLRGADGQVLTEVTHSRYTPSLGDLNGEPSTWTDARRAMRQFADKVADAYVAYAR